VLGIQSILHIPPGDDQPIQLIHASLRDFLTDKQRSKIHFIDPPICHISIAANCLTIMAKDANQNNFATGGAALYACRSWCPHLHAALIEGDLATPLDSFSYRTLEKCLQGFKSHSLNYWVNTLLYEGESLEPLNEIISRLNVSVVCPCLESKIA
jgi:hypothetical protein